MDKKEKVPNCLLGDFWNAVECFDNENKDYVNPHLAKKENHEEDIWNRPKPHDPWGVAKDYKWKIRPTEFKHKKFPPLANLYKPGRHRRNKTVAISGSFNVEVNQDLQSVSRNLNNATTAKISMKKTHFEDSDYN